MLAGWRELSTRIIAILGCLLFFWLLYCHLPKEGKELEVGTCEITALDRDMSHPKRMIARQTARCACRRGQVAGTTKAKPACVDAQIIVNKQWCGMEPCDEGEQCTLLINHSGWSCTRQLGRIKTVTPPSSFPIDFACWTLAKKVTNDSYITMRHCNIVIVSQGSSTWTVIPWPQKYGNSWNSKDYPFLDINRAL